MAFCHKVLVTLMMMGDMTPQVPDALCQCLEMRRAAREAADVAAKHPVGRMALRQMISANDCCRCIT